MRIATANLSLGLLIFGLLAVLAASGFAAAADAPAVLAIDPVPMTEPFDWAPPARNGSLDRLGMIERIDGQIIVISDAIRALAKDVVYRSRRDGPATTRGAFRAGEWVGYRLNEAREVAEIWLDHAPDGAR